MDKKDIVVNFRVNKETQLALHYIARQQGLYISQAIRQCLPCEPLAKRFAELAKKDKRIKWAEFVSAALAERMAMAERIAAEREQLNDRKLLGLPENASEILVLKKKLKMLSTMAEDPDCPVLISGVVTVAETVDLFNCFTRAKKGEEGYGFMQFKFKDRDGAQITKYVPTEESKLPKKINMKQFIKGDKQELKA